MKSLTKYKYDSFVFILAILCLIIINFLLILSFKGFIYDIKNNYLENILEEIKINFDSKLIYSFRLSTDCFPDEEPLILGKWEGKNLEINYTLINTSYICIKKSKSSYKDLLENNQIKAKYENCPIDYKSCGIVDTLGRKLCIKADEECPITLNEILRLNPYNDELDYNPYLNNNSDLFLPEKYDKILSIFTYINNYPCINPSEKWWKYYYEEEKESTKCETFINDNSILYDDFRYERLYPFYTSKYNLYKSNFILEHIKNYNENELKSDNVCLYGANFIGCNYEDFEKIYDEKENIISYCNISNICFKILKISMIIFFGLTFLVLFIFIIHIYYKCKENIDNLKKYSLFYIIVAAIDFLLNIILIVMIFVYTNLINSKLNSTGCDNYTDELLQNIIYGSNSINLIVPLSIIILVVIVGIISITLIAIKKIMKI